MSGSFDSDVRVVPTAMSGSFNTDEADTVSGSRLAFEGVSPSGSFLFSEG